MQCLCVPNIIKGAILLPLGIDIVKLICPKGCKNILGGPLELEKVIMHCLTLPKIIALYHQIR